MDKQGDGSHQRFRTPGLELGIKGGSVHEGLLHSSYKVHGLPCDGDIQKGWLRLEHEPPQQEWSAWIAQEYILVDAGHKEKVASHLAVKRHWLYSREKLVDLCKGTMSIQQNGYERRLFGRLQFCRRC